MNTSGAYASTDALSQTSFLLAHPSVDRVNIYRSDQDSFRPKAGRNDYASCTAGPAGCRSVGTRALGLVLVYVIHRKYSSGSVKQSCEKKLFHKTLNCRFLRALTAGQANERASSSNVIKCSSRIVWVV